MYYAMTTDESPIEVPASQLSPEALRALIESFVLREGTDYGEHQYTLAEKVEQVMDQVTSGEARIVFEPRDESIHIVTRRELP